MGDRVTFKYEDNQCCGIIVGFVTVRDIVNAIIRLTTGYYITKRIDCITYCE